MYVYIYIYICIFFFVACCRSPRSSNLRPRPLGIEASIGIKQSTSLFIENLVMDMLAMSALPATEPAWEETEGRYELQESPALELQELPALDAEEPTPPAPDLPTIFNKLFGKKMPTGEIGTADQREALADEIQNLMNSAGTQVAMMGDERKDQGIEDQGIGERERMLKEALELQGKFDMQKSKIGRMWKQHLKRLPELKEKYDAAGKDYTKQRAIRAAWNQEEWKVEKVALRNHGRQIPSSTGNP